MDVQNITLALPSQVFKTQPKTETKTHSEKSQITICEINKSDSVIKYEEVLNKLNSMNQSYIDKVLKNYPKDNLESLTKKIKNKINMINDYQDNFKCMIAYSSNDNLKYSSFSVKNYESYNLISFDEDYYKTYINNITSNKYNYTEHNYSYYSRLFFDIDYSEAEFDEDTENETEDDKRFNQLKELFNLIYNLSGKFDLKIYGYIEYNNDFKDKLNEIEMLNIENEDINLLQFLNTNMKKQLSGHIYLNGYSNRKDIEIYMKKVLYSKDKFNNIFDVSVYKTTKQSLRMPFSAKIDTDKLTIRKSNESTLEYLKYNISSIKDIILNCRMSPKSDDKYIDLKSEINNLSLIQKVNASSSTCKAKTNKITIKSNPSIFQYILDEDKPINIASLCDEVDNHFEFHQQTAFIENCVLTPEEIEKELLLIKLNEVDNSGKKYTEEDNNEFIDKVLNLKMKNYEQDLTNMKPLYYIKKVINTIYEWSKDKEKKKELDVDFKIIKLIIEKVNYYIEKYNNLSFITHDFYDVKNTVNDFNGNILTKKEKILYNCYIDNKYDRIIYVNGNGNEDIIFESKEQFKNYFRLSGETAKNIKEILTVFNSVSEFKKMKIEYTYSKLTTSQKEHLNNVVSELLNYLKNSFVYEEDYKFYISFYSSKLSQHGTLNKGIICQGTETEGAHDSLKTFFNDMLYNYLNIKSADINNINKDLNGGYFKSELLVIEETPKGIKDKDGFINKVKEFTSKENLTVEEKGMNPEDIKNKTDIEINTNHTVSQLFDKKIDCEALLKRFKILTRKSLNMKDKRLNEVLDEFKKSENKDLLRHELYLTLLNNDYNIHYFNKHSKDVNKVEKSYSLNATPDIIRDKKEIEYEFGNEFIEWFKKSFIQKGNNRLQIIKLLNYIKTIKSYSSMNQTTFKNRIQLILDVPNSETIILNKDNRLVFTKATNEDYFKIYDYFFEYVEPEKDENENEENENENSEAEEN